MVDALRRRRFIRQLCAWLMLVGLVTAARPVCSSEPDEGHADPRTVLPLLPNDTLAAMLVYPKSFFEAMTTRGLPTEFTSADLKARYGIDCHELEYAIFFLGRQSDGQLTAGLIAHGDRPIDWHRLPGDLLDRTDFGVINDRPYRRGRSPLDMSVAVLSEQTLIIAPDATLRRMLQIRDSSESATIAKRLADGLDKQLDVHLIANLAELRQLMQPRLQRLVTESGSWTGWTRLLAVSRDFELRGRMRSELAVGAQLETESADAAIDLLEQLQGWAAVPTPASEISTEQNFGEPSAQAVGSEPTNLVDHYLVRVTSQVLSRATTQAAGNRLRLAVRGSASDQMATCASIAMLARPLLDAGEACVRQWHALGSLAQLAQAITNYVADHERLPNYASFAPEGVPNLSWRVHLLPYLGHQTLYEQFHLDESWHSAHNRELIAKMPEVYRDPRRPSDYTTTYVLPVGDVTLFRKTPHALGVELREASDGLADTLMIVRVAARDAVVWTEPRDLNYDQRQPWKGLGRDLRDGFWAAAADTSLRFLGAELTAEQIAAFFSCAGQD